MASYEKNIPSFRAFLKQIIEQGFESFHHTQATYELMYRAESYGLGNEQWQKHMDDLKECQWKIGEVCQYLAEMDEQLAELEITVLYGPPSSFNE